MGFAHQSGCCMAKHGKRGRRFRKYLRGSVDEQLALGALATKDVVAGPYDETVNGRTWVTTHIATWTMDDFTPLDESGPVLVGIAHSDYNAAEIEAWIETLGSWDEGDLVSQELAKRKIRRVGIFESGADALASVVLNDGKPIRTKCNWLLNQGQSLQMWAYNLGTASLATTVPTVHVQGHVNLWPQ